MKLPAMNSPYFVPFMRLPMAVSRIAVAGACLSIVAGCNGVGKGSKPEKIEIYKAINADRTVVIDSEPKKAYTCITGQVGAVVTFTNGDRGDFSSRAHWTSDDPTVVRINDFNDVVPEDPTRRYPSGGVLTPISAGSTMVHVEYLGFTASLPVEVGTSENLRLLPADMRIAPKSTQTYSVRAVLDGQETDVTGVTTIRLLGADGKKASKRVATLEVSGTRNVQIDVVGVAASATPLTVKAKFQAPCATRPTTTVQVTDIPEGGLKIGYEKGYESTQLVQGTSELVMLTATFPDGKTQDLSRQPGTRFDYDRDGDGLCELTDEQTGTTTGSVAACADGLDNDKDGHIDLDDPGCADASDQDEIDPAPAIFGNFLTGLNLVSARTPACSDTRDNDGDSLKDFPGDTGCSAGDDNDETTDDTRNGTTDSTLVCASFGATGDTDGDGPIVATPGVLSDTVPLLVKNTQLDSFTIKAIDPCVPAETGCTPLPPFDEIAPTIDGGKIIRFIAAGLFVGGLTQDLTKDVSWTLSVGEAKILPASIGSGPSSAAGLVSTSGTFTNVDGCKDQPTCVVTVKATFFKGTSDTTDDKVATTTLTLNAQADDTTP